MQQPHRPWHLGCTQAGHSRVGYTYDRCQAQVIHPLPSSLRPMLRGSNHPVHRLITEARPQSFHQLRHRIAATATQTGKRIEGIGRQRLERTRFQFQGSHRRREFESMQFFIQHIRHAIALARDARQPQTHACHGYRAMSQLQFQCLNACLTSTQELCAVLDHRLQCLLQINDGLDFRLEIAALVKSLARYECSARGGLLRQCDVQIQDRGGAQAACHTGPRQTQQFAYSSHAHGAQGLQPCGIPGRAGDRQLRESTRQLSRIFDAYSSVGASQPQCRQSARSRRSVSTHREPAPGGIDACVQ